MKKFMSTAMAGAMLLLMASCSESGSISDSVEYMPVQLETGGKWGMVDPDGKMLFTDEFKNEPTVVIDGIFTVEEGQNGLYSIYKAGKKPELLKGCDGFMGVGTPAEGLIPVARKNERLSVISVSGVKKFDLMPIGDKEIISCGDYYSEGALAVQLEDNTFTYVDTKGKQIFKKTFAGAYGFNEGYALVSIEEVKGEESNVIKAVIDKKGEIVLKIKSDYTVLSTNVKHGLIAITDANDRAAFINLKGEVDKIPSKAQYIIDYNEKYVIFCNDEGDYGVMNRKGDVLIRPKYTSMQFYGDDRFLAGDDNEYMLLDSKGEKIFSTDEYSIIYAVGKFGLLAKSKKTAVLLDDKGKPKGKEEFTDVGFGQSRGSLHSDFFDPAAAAAQVTNLINEKGVGDYYIGEKADKLFESTDEATETITFSSLAASGLGWSMAVGGRMNTYPLKYEYDYFTSTTTFNPDSYLQYIFISLNTVDGHEWGQKGFDLTIKALQSKGFKATRQSPAQSDMAWALLTKGSVNLYVVVENKKDGQSMVIYVVGTADEINVSLTEELSRQDGTVAATEQVEEASEYLD